MIDVNLPFTAVACVDDITHEEWLSVRNTGIGGSDIGAIAGLNRWKTPMSVFMDKIGQGIEVIDNEKMYWGRILEDTVAREFSRRTGLAVEPFPYVLRSKQYPWMLANVDRLIVGREEGLECKTADASQKAYWEDGAVPDSYLLQCYHYMIVMGIKKWHIACLIGGNHFVHYTINYDEDIAASVIKQEKDFWDLVQAGTPPAVFGQDIDLLSMIYSHPEPTTIELDSRAEMLARDYKIASQQEKEAKSVKDDAKAKLCAMIGDNSKAVAGNIKISWTPVETDRFDTERFKTENPSLYNDYIKTTSSRRFTVK